MKYMGKITDNYDLVNKKYVDDAVAGGGGGGSYSIVTVAQLETGTDTTGYLISPKVLHDYLVSLDATNTAY